MNESATPKDKSSSFSLSRVLMLGLIVLSAVIVWNQLPKIFRREFGGVCQVSHYYFIKGESTKVDALLREFKDWLGKPDVRALLGRAAAPVPEGTRIEFVAGRFPEIQENPRSSFPVLEEGVFLRGEIFTELKAQPSEALPAGIFGFVVSVQLRWVAPSEAPRIEKSLCEAFMNDAKARLAELCREKGLEPATLANSSSSNIRNDLELLSR